MDLDLSITEPLEKRIEGKSFGSFVLKFRRPTMAEADKVNALTTVGAAEQRMNKGVRGIDAAADAYARMFRYKVECVITGWDDVWESAKDKDGNIVMENGKPKKVAVKYSFQKLMAACGRYPEVADEVAFVANALHAGLDPLAKDEEELEEESRQAEVVEKNLLSSPEVISVEVHEAKEKDQQTTQPSTGGPSSEN